MEPDRIIVVGASAGGVEAAMALVRELPADFPAALFITIHFPPDAESFLPSILARTTPLTVVPAEDRATIEAGTVYVARPGQHLLIRHGTIRLSRGPTENGNRPAIDPMFRSAALAYGPRVIGVVLTGNLDDGTSGMLAIKRRGGIAVVEDPDTAMFPSMPMCAIRHVRVDHVVPLSEIPALLRTLASQPVPERRGERAMDDARKEDELNAQLANRLGSRGAERLRERFHARSTNLHAQASIIREVLIDSARPDEG